MHFPHQIVNSANVIYAATVAAAYEDIARAVVLVIDVVGLFALTALRIEIPPQVWVISGVVVGYFFGRVVNFAAAQIPTSAPKSKK